jgi:hypothetical protein
MDDMRKPQHKIGFSTPRAAERFIERLSIALSRVGVGLR